MLRSEAQAPDATVVSRVPVADPQAGIGVEIDSIRSVLHEFLKRGSFILGREVASFEDEFAAFIGMPHCIGVANGTDAIEIALRAVGIVPGDEVVTVSHTAVATVAAIERAGAVPVFADIDRDTRCMSPESVEACIGPQTRALVPVHLYGQPAPMEALRHIAQRHGLKIVEDCAQAHGAYIDGQHVGSFGDAAAFSFYPTKNLGALGDGGAIVTADENVARYAREARQYGWRNRYVSDFPGVNSRLDEIQAAVLRIRLKRLSADVERRRAIAARYTEACPLIVQPPTDVWGTTHAMHLYVVETDRRDALAAHFESRGISTAIHYPLPVHLQPAYRGRLRGGDALAETEAVCRRILSLPMFPELTDPQIGRVCDALQHFAP